VPPYGTRDWLIESRVEVVDLSVFGISSRRLQQCSFLPRQRASKYCFSAPVASSGRGRRWQQVQTPRTLRASGGRDRGAERET
jgi:hypothetical protein